MVSENNNVLGGAGNSESFKNIDFVETLPTQAVGLPTLGRINGIVSSLQYIL